MTHKLHSKGDTNQPAESGQEIFKYSNCPYIFRIQTMHLSYMAIYNTYMEVSGVIIGNLSKRGWYIIKLTFTTTISERLMQTLLPARYFYSHFCLQIIHEVSRNKVPTNDKYMFCYVSSVKVAVVFTWNILGFYILMTNDKIIYKQNRNYWKIFVFVNTALLIMIYMS